MEPLKRAELRVENRLRAATVLLIIVFLLFTLRLFQLQFLKGDALRERSQRNSVRSLQVEAPRGELLDREGRSFATVRAAYQLQVVPGDLRDPERTYIALAQLLGDDVETLRQRGGATLGGRRFQPVVLRDDLDFDALARLEAHSFAMPGATIAVLPRRFYPKGALGAHLLGTLGRIRADQIELEDYAGYRGSDVIGQTGIERRFESHLRGAVGGRNVVVDVAGRVVEVLGQVRPVPGGRVVLALDWDLQQAAEAAFRSTAPDQPAHMGAAVALDVRNGDVLVLASLPAYDPNDFVAGTDPERWQALVGDEWQPLRNRAIQNHYPPGSVHKAFVAAALLAEGVIDEHSSVFCPGYFRYGGRNYRCWQAGGHGQVNLRKALKRSCDVFFYTFGVQLGVDRLARHAASFGIGQRTGVALPDEAPGLLPTSDWKFQNKGEVWLPGETVSVSIGQSYNLYTPIQLAVAYAALANGGEVLKPRLALRLEDEHGETEHAFPREVVGRISISAEQSALVQEGLVAVVEESGGTGRRARVPGVRVAGKTGTVQVVNRTRTVGLEESEIPIRHRDHAWFVAFAPAEAPEIAVAVFVEHGLHGGSTAAPIAQKILSRYFEKRAAEQEVLAGRDGRALD